MLIIKGKYNEAVVYAEEVEPESREQIKTLCDQPFAAGSKIRIMPDVHAGAGCTIGTTMTVRDEIAPNLAGVDIGCGIEVARLDAETIDFAKLDAIIRRDIPSAFRVRRTNHAFAADIDLTRLRCAEKMNIDRAYKSIGTLGGGNHFIEVGKGGAGGLFLAVHSGSRHLGHEVATYYQSMGLKMLSRARDRLDTEKIIAELKAAGREDEIAGVLKDLRGEMVPKSLACVKGGLFRDYLHDMELTQRYADLNRRAMMRVLTEGLGVKAVERFATIHNYIDTRSMILRKGAVSAEKGEKLIIPLNMRDGSLICVGKGNPEWNCSAPHGAGRVMSRAEARKQLSFGDYEKSMKGIYSTSVSKATLDEAPMAYKPMDEIIGVIGETVEIVDRVVPVYNFKASG